jgi:hypothetical protein|tara:strand:- start:2678 stop:4321 length:1644 start_codon:yes stop_codon:yes gene_type:complete
MAKKVIDIIYNLVRKRLAVFNTKASGSGITRIPTDRQIKKSMQDVFQTLKDGGYNVMSAEKVIQNEDDLARVLTEIQQKQIADAAARKKASEGLERILDKMDRNIPLNPSDQISLEGSGFKTTKDAFKGFEPKVIPGGKKPRDKKSKGGLATALAKLKKKFGKDIIQKGKAPKRNEKKKLQDLFREFNRKNKAGGGVAHMLGEPREEMAAGGIPLRRLLQFLHQGMDKPEKASKGLKKMKLPKQMKFFAEKQGFNPDQVRIDYLENVLDGLKKDRDLIKSVERSPTKNELENMASGAFRESFVDTTQGGRFKGLDSEMIESSILELETILKNLKTKGQGRKLNADGGRIGFADGGMSRRTFLKIMAALAAFPVVGKLAKTTKIAKGAKPIVTPTADMPAHFPKLVEKIIREGQVVKKDFIKKTGDVTTYKHPDRPDIELTIEGDGNRIQLDFDTDQGMKGGYEFKKGIPDETVPKPPDEFTQGEVKYRMSPEGDYTKDFEEIIDTGTENLDEFAGVGKQKTSKSKVNLPESLDDDFADGGLAGLLGE